MKSCAATAVAGYVRSAKAPHVHFPIEWEEESDATEELRLPEAPATLEELILPEMARVEFRRLVAPFGDRLHAVVTLLAGLELAKQHVLAMRQREVFAPLWLYRRNGKKPDAHD